MSYQIAVVGGDHLVSDAIRFTWKVAGADLIRPSALPLAASEVFLSADGALLNVLGDAGDLFILSERLETSQIPFLYVISSADLIPGAGFNLSADPLEISASFIIFSEAG
jgi:hypothetical protein